MELTLRKYSIIFFLITSNYYLYIEEKNYSRLSGLIVLANLFFTSFLIYTCQFNVYLFPLVIIQNYIFKHFIYRIYIYLYQIYICILLKGIDKEKLYTYFSDINNLIKSIKIKNLLKSLKEIFIQFGKLPFIKSNQDINHFIYTGIFTLILNNLIYGNTIIEFYIFYLIVIIVGSKYDFRILDVHNSIFSIFMYSLIIINATSNFYLLLLPNIVFCQFLLKIIDPKIQYIVRIILYSKLLIQIL